MFNRVPAEENQAESVHKVPKMTLTMAELADELHISLPTAAGAKIRLSRVQRRQQDSHQPGRASALAGWSAADCCHLNFFAKCTCPVL